MITINIFLIMAQLSTFTGCNTILRSVEQLKVKLNHEEKYGLCRVLKTYKRPNLVLAMAFKESSIKSNKVNLKSLDYGMLQVNIRTAKAHNMNHLKMLTNTEYGLQSGIHILQYFLDRYGAVEGVMRYNCGTRKSCIKQQSVIDYYKSVNNIRERLGALK